MGLVLHLDACDAPVPVPRPLLPQLSKPSQKVDGRRGPALELSVRFGDAKEKLSEA